MTLPPGSVTGFAVEDDYMLTWMDKGTCRIELNGEALPLTTHDLVLARPGDSTNIEWNRTPGRIGYVKFDPAADESWPAHRAVTSADVLPALLRHVLWLQMEKPEGWADQLQMAFDYVLLALRSGHSGTDLESQPNLPPIIEHVMARLGELWGEGPTGPVNLRELASFAQVTPEYLSRVFTRELGIPPATALRLLRLDLAARQLRATTSSIREVAIASGFQNEFYFSHAFKLWAGVAPTVYRAGNLPGPELPSAIEPLARYLRRHAIESELHGNGLL